MTNLKLPIAHPDWLELAMTRTRRTCKLYKSGVLPKSIQGFMIQTNCRYLLRSIYGSNFKAARALMWMAIVESVRNCWRGLYRFWIYKVLLHNPETTLRELLEEERDD